MELGLLMRNQIPALKLKHLFYVTWSVDAKQNICQQLVALGLSGVR